jgi:hypothetical protein
MIYVYGNEVDIKNVQEYANSQGVIGFEYRVWNPARYTINKSDIVVGGPGAINGVTDAQLNGAVRIWGATRRETINAFVDYAKKLGPTGYYPNDNIAIREAGATVGSADYGSMATLGVIGIGVIALLSMFRK